MNWLILHREILRVIPITIWGLFRGNSRVEPPLYDLARGVMQGGFSASNARQDDLGELAQYNRRSQADGTMIRRREQIHCNS